MNQDFAKYIDHSLLLPQATSTEIIKLCSEAKEYGFFAVCVNPVHVRLAVKELASSEAAVVTVIGFPLGANLTDIKIAEAQRAIAEGAEEIDMVINIGALKEGNINYVTNEIVSIVKVAKHQRLKVIIECDLLSKEEKVAATKACMAAGAFMVKTSTSFAKNGVGATVEDILLLKETIGGSALKIKASAGIKNYAQAKALIEAGASRLGTSAGVKMMEEYKTAREPVACASS